MGNVKITQAQLDSVVTAINNRAKSSSLASVATSGSYADLTNKPSIPTATDILPSQTGNSGKFLTTDGTTANWQSPKEVINLADGKDVSITSPANGQVLSWNGSAWVNSSVSVPVATASVYGGIKVSLSGTTLTITA